MRTQSEPKSAGVAARIGTAALSGLPEWDLSDLYPGMSAPTLQADIDRAVAESIAFEQRWKGTLADEAARVADSRLGEALRAYEALEELIGRIASYAGLVYAGDTSTRSAPSCMATSGEDDRCQFAPAVLRARTEPGR